MHDTRQVKEGVCWGQPGLYPLLPPRPKTESPMWSPLEQRRSIKLTGEVLISVLWGQFLHIFWVSEVGMVGCSWTLLYRIRIFWKGKCFGQICWWLQSAWILISPNLEQLRLRLWFRNSSTQASSICVNSFFRSRSELETHSIVLLHGQSLDPWCLTQDCRFPQSVWV